MEVEAAVTVKTEEEKLIEEEYVVWKKNSPFLYDLVVTHALEWPSLTVQWLPEESVLSKDLVSQKLILGTQTGESEGDINYLMIADVMLPSPTAEVDARQFNKDKDELGNYAGTMSKISIKVKIVHDGDVHRARYMPQNPFVIAAKSPQPDVLVFDYSKHPSNPPDGVCRPQHRLKGHSEGGYGLSWNPNHEGKLASASTDGSVCVWDIMGASVDVDPLHYFHHHTKGVEDVDWNKHIASIFASVGDDGKLIIYDIRDPSKAKQTIQAHDGDANCVSFNYHNEFVLATGAGDGVVKLWDLRNMSTPTHDLLGHKEGVYQLSWAPFDESILASSSEDRRVNVWDTARIGLEQDPEDAEDGPPELLFIHGGHTAKVFDFSWSTRSDWLIASVAEDNVLQVWQVAESIYNDEEEEGGEDGQAAEQAGGGGVADEDLEAEDGQRSNKRQKH